MSVPNNVLASGSVWESDIDGLGNIASHKRINNLINAAIIHRFSNIMIRGARAQKVYSKNSKYLNLLCVDDIEARSGLKGKRLCEFILSAKFLEDGTACICEFKDHSCNGTFSYARKNPPLKYLSQVDGSILDNFHVNENKSHYKNETAKCLLETVRKSGGIPISNDQAKRLVSQRRHNNLLNCLEDLAQLPYLIESLKRDDPEGIYILEVQSCDYIFDPTSNVYSFGRIFIMPSWTIHFFKHSRRGGSIDAAHMTGKLQGFKMTFVVKNALGENVTICQAIVSNENKYNWEWFLGIVFKYLNDILYLISDKAKGLDDVKCASNNHDILGSERLVYINDCIHALANANCNTQDGKLAVTIWAKSATEEELIKNKESLVKATTAEIVENLLEKNENDCITFLDARKKGLLSSYGEMTSNGVEQTNNSDHCFRGKPFTSALRTFLRVSQEKYEHHRCLSSKIAKDIKVVESVTKSVFLKAKEMSKYWRVVRCGYTNDNQIEAFVCKGDEVSMEYTVTLTNNRDLPWYECVLCRCNQTLLYGKPCAHACAVFLTISDKSKLFPSNKWGIHRRQWYSTIFHVERFQEQYNSRGIMFNIENILPKVRLLPYQLYCPVKLKRARIKFKNRKTKPNEDKSFTKPDEYDTTDEVSQNICVVTDNHDLQSNDFEVSSDTSEVPYNVMQMFLDDSKKDNRSCAVCKRVGHNVNGCQFKETQVLVRKYGSFLFSLENIVNMNHIHVDLDYCTKSTEVQKFSNSMKVKIEITPNKDAMTVTSQFLRESVLFKRPRQVKSPDSQMHIVNMVDEPNENQRVKRLKRPIILLKSKPIRAIHSICLQGFQWESNSCAFDTVYTVLIQLYYAHFRHCNMKNESFIKNTGLMEDCFRSLPNENAFFPCDYKLRFLTTCYTYLCNASKTSNLSAYGANHTISIMTTILNERLDENHEGFKFTSIKNDFFSIIESKDDECKCGNVNHVSTFARSYLIASNDNIHLSIAEVIAERSASAHCSLLSPQTCSLCGSTEMQRNACILSSPKVLFICIDSAKDHLPPRDHQEHFDDYATYGEVKYYLFSVIYHINSFSHFFGILRRNNSVYTYDVMENNGCFQELDSSNFLEFPRWYFHSRMRGRKSQPFLEYKGPAVLLVYVDVSALNSM